ncbi:hypothetical protein OHA21_27495 [Actinoplanes sp. NBC_00393]|uniref:hypothetical protein n=1 Tax=Actinoplanes sp. NBC_00393 TaxID=2975953 RepID=UPI002E1F452A
MRLFVPGLVQPPPVTDIADSTSDVALLDAISQSSIPAFLILLDRTSAAVHAVLAELPPGYSRDEIFAASYLEVWWLAGCHIGPDLDVAAWITGIARRRIADVRTGPRPDRDQQQPGYAQLEFAAMFHRPNRDPLARMTVKAGSIRAGRSNR